MTNQPFRVGSDPAPPSQSPATEAFWLSAQRLVHRIKFFTTYPIPKVSIRQTDTATRGVPTWKSS